MTRTNTTRYAWRFILPASLVPLALIAWGLAVLQPALAAPDLQLTLFPTPTPGADGRILYVVQEQDTLWRISAITGVSLDELRALNKLGADDIISPGDVLLIGIAGPTLVTATPGPSPTPPPQEPTPTALAGSGNLCIILYNDLNGDAIRQEDEPWITDGQISVTSRDGSFSETAPTEPLLDEDGEIGYLCFEELAEGNYNVTVAIPEGYNPTTVLSRALVLLGGDETFLSFGAQVNSENPVVTTVIPETPDRSPLLAIVGGILLLIGLGVGFYALLLYRGR